MRAQARAQARIKHPTGVRIGHVRLCTHTDAHKHRHSHAHTGTLTRTRALASAHTNNHALTHAPTPLLPRTVLRAPNSTSDGCLPRFKRRHSITRGIWMRPCAWVCTRAHVCALMHTYTINSCMDSLPSTQFCELLNSTSDGCFPQFKHQHNER